MSDSLTSKEVDPMLDKKHKRPRILIVDDEQTLRDVWQEVLAEEGYEVETVESPEHALLVLENERFDLVLLDEVFKAGPFDGLDTFRKVRGLFHTLPVIMMTGYSDVEESIAQAVQEGAYRQVIKKPSTIAEITGIVSDCLLESKKDEDAEVS